MYYYGAIITMQNNDKFFLNGAWNSRIEAKKAIENKLGYNFANCVNAEDDDCIIITDNISSIEIVDTNTLDIFKKEIIENKRYRPENIFRALKTIYDEE